MLYHFQSRWECGWMKKFLAGNNQNWNPWALNCWTLYWHQANGRIHEDINLTALDCTQVSILLVHCYFRREITLWHNKLHLYRARPTCIVCHCSIYYLLTALARHQLRYSRYQEPVFFVWMAMTKVTTSYLSPLGNKQASNNGCYQVK